MASICPSCGEPNREGAPFCGMCKAVLQRARSSSASPPPPIARAPIAPPPIAAPIPERSAPTSPPAGTTLVVLDPPHAREVDLAAIGAVLELGAADARMRVGLAIPSPLAMHEDGASAERMASALRAAGLSVTLPSVNELALQPAQEEVRSFQLDDGGLSFSSAEGDGRFAWTDLRAAFLVLQSSFAVRESRMEREALNEARRQIDAGFRHLALGMRYAARSNAGRALRQLAVAEDVRGTLAETATLTLHLVARVGPEGALAHLVLTKGSLRYEGLGAHRGSGAEESWNALLARVGALAPHVTLDRRAERAPPRFPAIPGIARAFGGKVPSASWLHGAYLSWRAS